MAKKTKFKLVDLPALPTSLQTSAPPAAAAAAPAADESSGKVPHAFPSKSRCPICKSLATRRRGESDDGAMQLRACLKPSCRKRYSVPGVPV